MHCIEQCFFHMANFDDCFSAYTCKIGDGNGSSEEVLSGKYTKENCITAVREQHPTANGATMKENCPSTCACFAEFGMIGWKELSSYQSCMFKFETTSSGK